MSKQYKKRLSKADARKLYRISTDKKYSVRLDLGNRIQYIPINNITREFIIDLLTRDKNIIEREDSYGSDVLDKMTFIQIKNISVTAHDQTKFLKNKNGKFFPYLNTTNLDLSKYQIFNQEQADINNNSRYKIEHCIIHSLLQCGISEALVNSVKLSIEIGASFQQKHLNKVANIIQKNIRLYYYAKNNEIKKTVFKCDRETEKYIEIAMYAEHYIVYEKSIYSSFFINNYDEFKDHKDCHRITRMKKKKVVRTNDSKINSLRMVKILYENNKFQKLNMIDFDENSTNKETRDHIYLDNIENEQYLIEIPKEKEEEKEKDEKFVVYADCETVVTGEKHELLMLGYVFDKDKDDYVESYNINEMIVKEGVKQRRFVNEQALLNKFFDDVTKNGKRDGLVYFHNLKYDYNILESLLTITGKCEKQNNIYSVNVIHNKRIITFVDSYKLVSVPLKKFPSMFQLPAKYKKQEAIAYEYYNHENHDKEIKTEDYRKLLSRKERRIFDEVVVNKELKERWKYHDEEKTFNPTEYYKYYLEYDCLVLKKGIQKFDSLIKEITDNIMTVYDCLTISSLTDKYLIKKGCYEGVYQSTGNLREYISRAVSGGRVCVNPLYKKKVIEERISDYDGVSLYPSAIKRVADEIGLPTGKAKRFEKDDLVNWKNKTYSIMTVKITKINKKQQIPFISYKKNGILEYSNEPPNHNIIIDSITLEDYIKFHKIEYELLDGVYWNQGGNKKIGEEIFNLFKTRLKYKNTNEALANTIKLMLNSAYGKTILSKTKTKKKILKYDQRKIDNYICNNFSTIKSYRPVNKFCWEVEEIGVDESYNRGHCGCLILSMSKRIMNEVFDIANDNDIVIYYTDTDSIHMKQQDVSKLENLFREQYKKELNGKNLGQFHVDFQLEGAVGEIVATKSIFLGKKSYMDRLESVDKDGNKIIGYHCRMKGATREGLAHAAKQYDNSYEGLYEDLAQGNKINILMNPYDEEEHSKKVMFEFGKGFVKTREDNYRTLKF